MRTAAPMPPADCSSRTLVVNRAGGSVDAVAKEPGKAEG